MRRAVPIAGVLLLLLGGCFDSHLRGPSFGFDAGPRPGRDAGRFDSAFPRFDSGPRPDADFRFDSGFRFDSAPPDGGARPDGTIIVFDTGPLPDSARPDTGPRPDSGTPDSGGPPRPALRFGALLFLTVADAADLDAPTSHTIELWFRSRAPFIDASFCQKGDPLARHYVIGQRGGRIVAGWELAFTQHFLEGPPVLPDTWTHVALTSRADASGAGQNQDLYVNGLLVASASGVPDLLPTFNEREFRCGALDADVDEIRLWRAARSGSDIAADMARRVSGGNPQLIAYWRLDEFGQLAFDYTASGHIGILGFLTTPDAADPTWIIDGPF